MVGQGATGLPELPEISQREPSTRARRRRVARLRSGHQSHRRTECEPARRGAIDRTAKRDRAQRCRHRQTAFVRPAFAAPANPTAPPVTTGPAQPAASAASASRPRAKPLRRDQLRQPHPAMPLTKRPSAPHLTPDGSGPLAVVLTHSPAHRGRAHSRSDYRSPGHRSPGPPGTAVGHCSRALQSGTAVGHCSRALQSGTAVGHCSRRTRSRAYAAEPLAAGSRRSGSPSGLGAEPGRSSVLRRQHGHHHVSQVQWISFHRTENRRAHAWLDLHQHAPSREGAQRVGQEPTLVGL
jgi:hypothetical protein